MIWAERTTPFMEPVVSITDAEGKPSLWSAIKALSDCNRDLDKRLQVIERQQYLMMWLLGIVGTVLTSVMAAILIKLIV